MQRLDQGDYLKPELVVLSASSAGAIKRNAIALPAYSVLLGIIGLLGLMAHAAGIQVTNPQDAVPSAASEDVP